MATWFTKVHATYLGDPTPLGGSAPGFILIWFEHRGPVPGDDFTKPPAQYPEDNNPKDRLSIGY